MPGEPLPTVLWGKRSGALKLESIINTASTLTTMGLLRRLEELSRTLRFAPFEGLFSDILAALSSSSSAVSFRELRDFNRRFEDALSAWHEWEGGDKVECGGECRGGASNH